MTAFASTYIVNEAYMPFILFPLKLIIPFNTWGSDMKTLKWVDSYFPVEHFLHFSRTRRENVKGRSDLLPLKPTLRSPFIHST